MADAWIWFAITFLFIALIALGIVAYKFFRRLYFMVDEIDAKVLRIYDMLVAKKAKARKAMQESGIYMLNHKKHNHHHHDRHDHHGHHKASG